MSGERPVSAHSEAVAEALEQLRFYTEAWGLDQLDDEVGYVREAIASLVVALDRVSERLRREVSEHAAAVQHASDLQDEAEARAQQLEEAARDAETLLTNYLVAHKFPPGSDCEEVRDMLRHVLSPAPQADET